MLLEARVLSVVYGYHEAVRNLSFGLEPCELVSLLGAGGAGKTSVLNAVMGLEPARGGRIRFDAEDITRLPVHARTRRGIRMVQERSRVFPRLSVNENILTGTVGLEEGKLPLAARLDWLYGIFPSLRERRGRLAGTLNGGEQWQLAIARALVSAPRLLLVDEVATGLAPELADQVFGLLRRLNREYGLTILLAEQNAEAALRISDRSYVLEAGACRLSGTAAELREDPRLKAAFLG